MQTEQAVAAGKNATELESIINVLSSHNRRLKEITASLEVVGEKLRNSSSDSKEEQILPPKSNGTIYEIRSELDLFQDTTNRLDDLYSKLKLLV